MTLRSFFSPRRNCSSWLPMKSQNDRVYAPLATRSASSVLTVPYLHAFHFQQVRHGLVCDTETGLYQPHFLLSLEQKSTGSTTETRCWWRRCYQQSTARHCTIISQLLRFPKIKWLQLSGKVGKFMSFWCPIFSGSHTPEISKIG